MCFVFGRLIVVRLLDFALSFGVLGFGVLGFVCAIWFVLIMLDC